MNRKKISAVIITLTLTVSFAIIFNSGCFINDDETRVTINLQRNDLGMNYYVPEKRMIDRVLEFFATRGYAYSGWKGDIGDLTLKIKSKSFDEMSFVMPSDSTTYSVVVPAVSNVTFEITSFISSGEAGEVPQNWGGHTTNSLSPGEQELYIQMIPMTQIKSAYGSMPLIVAWVNENIPYVTSYRVYRADTETGQYIYKGPETVINIDEASYNDFDVVSGRTYYYRVSVVSSYGEGVLCDPVPGTSL